MKKFLIVNEYGECTFVEELTESVYAASNRGDVTIINYEMQTYHCNSEWVAIGSIKKMEI